MAKKKEAEPEAGDGAAEGEAAPKKGLFANKKLLIIIAAALLVLIGGGAGAYFFLFSGAKPAGAQEAKADPDKPLVPPTIAFYDMPDIVVNIQSQDGNPAFLKLAVSLELKSADEQAGLKVLTPRIVDEFQGYLRELRVEDLRGSASVVRIKEELLRRINVAAKPYRVEDVLLKEMIVQ